MIKSPGWAASIALWIVAEAATWVGGLPPTVTVTVSIDCLPLPAVITSSPHWAAEPPYCTCCWMVQAGTPAGTVAIIELSPQLVMAAGTPPMVTLETAVQVELVEVHWAPKP